MIGGSQSAPVRERLILLGASNLTRGISTVVETAGQICGVPLDIYAALGHGRSYGQTSSVLGRRLPGIVDCGLWPSLARPTETPAKALITDIGNDLLYGANPETIIEWIDQCLQRLADVGTHTIITLLPVQNLDTMTVARYLFFRTVLFPRCRLDLDAITHRAQRLDTLLKALGAARGAVLVRPEAGWYGRDPIHVKWRHWSDAWSTIMAPWNGAESKPNPAVGSVRRWLYLRSRMPEYREVWGRVQKRQQPSGRLPDGSTLALF